MHTTSLRTLLRAVIATVALTCASAFAANSDLGENVGTIQVPAGMSAKDVRVSITAALQGREWGVKE